MTTYLMGTTARRCFAPELEGNRGSSGSDSENKGGIKEGDGNKDEPKDFFATNKDMWQPKTVTPDPDADKKAQEARERTNTGLSNHIKSKMATIGVGLTPEALKSAMESGDPKVLKEAIDKSLETMYTSLLQDNTTMLEGMMKQMKEDSKNQTKTQLSIKEAEESLKTAHPFVAEAALWPIAKSIKGTFLNQGKSDDEANALVGEFFDSTAKKMGYQKDDPNRPSRGGRSQSTPAGDINWADVLTGKDMT